MKKIIPAAKAATENNYDSPPLQCRRGNNKASCSPSHLHPSSPPLLPPSSPTSPPRYLLPALCHLSAEDGPRKVLLSLEAPALLVEFVSRGWARLKGRAGVATPRDPGLETACSALLNFTVTEPDSVRLAPP